MKRLVILTSLFITSSLTSQAKTVTLNIPDDEIKIVENDVIDAEQWIIDAWRGKVDHCKGRLIQSEIERSIKQKEALPAGDDAIIKKAFDRPDYESRKKREGRIEQERAERSGARNK